MRKRTAILLLLAIWVTTTAALCNRTDDNDTNVQNNIFNGGNPVTGPVGGAETCSPVGSVRISAIPGSLGVGDSGRIDATPRDVFNQIRSDACNEASGATWTVEDTDICTVQDPGQFTTSVTGRDDGDCELTVTVDEKTATGTFPVN